MRRRIASSSGKRELPLWLQHLSGYMGHVIGFVMCLVVVVVAIRVAREWNDRFWFGREPYRILVLHMQKDELSSVSVVSVWPDTHKAVRLSIDPSTHIAAVGGYGSYRLGAFLELGRVENVEEKLLMDSLSFTLGVPIHSMIKTTNPRSIITKVKHQEMLQAVKGQRSMAQALDMWKLLSSVKDESVVELELSQRNAVRTRTEVDGSQVSYLEPALLDYLVNEYFSGRWNEAAEIQVAVINATGKANMASVWSRLPRTSGYDVVSVSEQQDRLEESVLLVSPEFQDRVEVSILTRLFPGVEVKVDDVRRYRSDIALIVGTDLWRWLYEREGYLETVKN